MDQGVGATCHQGLAMTHTRSCDPLRPRGTSRLLHVGVPVPATGGQLAPGKGPGGCPRPDWLA